MIETLCLPGIMLLLQAIFQKLSIILSIFTCLLDNIIQHKVFAVQSTKKYSSQLFRGTSFMLMPQTF